MPPSHQRHRRSPFTRTSFRRTPSGSSSLRSFSEAQWRSDDFVKSQVSNPLKPGWEDEDVLIRHVDEDKHSTAFYPTVTVAVCRDGIAVMRKEDGETSPSQPQFRMPRCENTKGGMQGRDASPSASSIYSIDTLGYPYTDPDKDADHGLHESGSSVPRFLGLSLETSTSRSAISDASFLNNSGKDGRDVGMGMGMGIASSRRERRKTFGRVRGKARGFLGSRKARDGDGNGNGDGDGEGDRVRREDEEEEGNKSGEGKEKHAKHERKLRPFLRKYCLHPFSMRSSFRLVGCIEDPVGCRMGHEAAYGTGYTTGYGEMRTGYAYGGGIGDARLWNEARRSGLEGGLY